jgi:hypothetical protein
MAGKEVVSLSIAPKVLLTSIRIYRWRLGYFKMNFQM